MRFRLEIRFAHIVGKKLSRFHSAERDHFQHLLVVHFGDLFFRIRGIFLRKSLQSVARKRVYFFHRACNTAVLKELIHLLFGVFRKVFRPFRIARNGNFHRILVGGYFAFYDIARICRQRYDRFHRVVRFLAHDRSLAL